MHEKSPMKGGEFVLNLPFNNIIGSNPNKLDLICTTDNSNKVFRFDNVTKATSLDKAILGSKNYHFLTENIVIFRTCSGNTYIANIGNISIE